MPKERKRELEKEQGVGKVADSSDINNIITVNESVKQVVGISRKVYLIALNAMFMARKTDGMASGFGSVTTELRGFSDRLERQMQSLAEGIYQLVQLLAQLLKQQRYRGYLEQTSKNIDDPLLNQQFDEVLARHNSYLKQTADDFEVQKSRVLCDLEKASKLCDMGDNLAVLAKIESVGTGSLSAALKQVSEQIELTVMDIHDVLGRAITSLGKQGHKKIILNAAEERAA